MFRKLMFRISHFRLKKHPTPYKLFTKECAAKFSYFLSKDEDSRLREVGMLAEKCEDLKNQIDDYGHEDYPEEPPFPVEKYEEMKRTIRRNYLLMIGFVIFEGAFNYFAFKALFPGRGVVFEGIRIAAAVVVSLVALFLVEGTIHFHFNYVDLKTKAELTDEDKRRLERLKWKRIFYAGTTVLLAVVLLSLGIVREFIIAGGVSINLWAMLVTVGLAIVIAIALGLQGAEVTEVIYKYRRMKKWLYLKERIDAVEKRMREKLDEIHRKIEESISTYWGWMYYLKYWLRRPYDDDDLDKSEEEKENLVYTNFDMFKQSLFDQSSSTIQKLEDLETRYENLIKFYPTRATSTRVGDIERQEPFQMMRRDSNK